MKFFKKIREQLLHQCNNNTNNDMTIQYYIICILYNTVRSYVYSRDRQTAAREQIYCGPRTTSTLNA